MSETALGMQSEMEVDETGFNDTNPQSLQTYLYEI